MSIFFRTLALTVLVFNFLGLSARSNDNVLVQIVPTKDQDGIPHFALSVTNDSKSPIVLEPDGTALYARLVTGENQWQPLTRSWCQIIHLSPTSMKITDSAGKVLYTSPPMEKLPEEPVLRETVLPAGKTTLFIKSRVIPGICFGTDTDPFAVYGSLNWKFVNSSDKQSSLSAVVRTNDMMRNAK